MELTRSRIASLCIAGFYVLGMIAHQQGITEAVVKGRLALLLPLALIWFPEQLGNYRGYAGYARRIDQPSPPILVTALGWFILIVMPGVLFYLRG